MNAGTNSVANVDKTAAPWTGLTQDDLPVGTMVYHCNDKGQPIAYTPFCGRGALLRAYGQEMNYENDARDYGFRTGQAYEAMYGDATPVDRLNRVRNSVIIASAWKPSARIPTIA